MINGERLRLALDLITTFATVVVAAVAFSVWVGWRPVPTISRAPLNTPGVSEEVSGLETEIGAASMQKGAPRIALIEFADFQCPFCGKAAREAHPQLRRDFIESGKIQYVFRHYPLESIHPLAMEAGEAMECARIQGMHWELHERLFADQQRISHQDLVQHARALGLDSKQFEECLGRDDTRAAIERDIDEGKRLGVDSTPTMFIGEIQSGGKVKLLKVIRGAVPYDALKSELSQLSTNLVAQTNR